MYFSKFYNKKKNKFFPKSTKIKEQNNHNNGSRSIAF